MARRLSQAPGAFREVFPRVALALFLPLFAFVCSAASETPAASASAPPEPRMASCNTPGDAHVLKGTVTDPTGAAISSASVVFLCGAATGTKTDTALVEVPQSVSVITLEELKDRNVHSLDQALQYTPGVSPSVYGQDDRFDWITIRGFAAQNFGLFRDGRRW